MSVSPSNRTTALNSGRLSLMERILCSCAVSPTTMMLDALSRAMYSHAAAVLVRYMPAVKPPA